MVEPQDDTSSAQGVVISLENNSDFNDSSHTIEHNHEIDTMAHEENDVEGSSNAGTQDVSVKNEECMENSSHNNSDFCNSRHISLHHHEIAAIPHEADGCVELSNVDTQDLGVNDAICVVDSCHHKSNFVYQTLEDVNKSEKLHEIDES